MTTEVRIESPFYNHQDVMVLQVDPSSPVMTTTGTPIRLAAGESLKGVVHGGSAFLTIEVPKDPERKPRELTFGEKAVGLTFNVGGSAEVDVCKRAYAAIIDQMNDLRARTGSPEVKRLSSLAITEAQGAQMWAVKAITWKD